MKIEPREGDPLRRTPPFADGVSDAESSLLFMQLNTNKQSVTLDLEPPLGRDTFRRLVAAGDIVVDSSGRGRLAGLGLGAATFTETSPSTIFTSITAFGEESDYADYRGGELVLLALGGLLHMVGEPEQPPVRLGGHQAQYATGLSALTGTLAALLERDCSGLGQLIEVSVLESVAYTEWKSGIYFQHEHRVRRRGGRDAQWLVLPCSDGFVGFVYQDEDWVHVQELIGDPRLADACFATRAGRLKQRQDLGHTLARWTRQRTKLEVYHQAQARHIPVGMVATIADLMVSPQYQERRYFEPIEHPRTGAARYAGIPATLDGDRPALRRAPLLGEHNEQVYRDVLHLDADHLARLRAHAII